MKEFERDRKDYHAVGKCIPKKDSEQLLLGKPVFMDDIVHEDCLVVKILRSPHAHALIEDINTAAAMKVPGIVAVYTWKDVPQNRFSIAGQTFPEPSPYDRLILDQRVRSVGDAVAIVAGETEKAVDKALRVIKVKYQVLEPVLELLSIAGELKLLSRGIWRRSVLTVKLTVTDDFTALVLPRLSSICAVSLPRLLVFPNPRSVLKNRGSAVGLVPSRRQSVRCIRRLLPG